MTARMSTQSKISASVQIESKEWMFRAALNQRLCQPTQLNLLLRNRTRSLLGLNFYAFKKSRQPKIYYLKKQYIHKCPKIINIIMTVILLEPIVQGMRQEFQSAGAGVSWRPLGLKIAGAHSTRSLKIIGCKR